jgi:hypothetical protein
VIEQPSDARRPLGSPAEPLLAASWLLAQRNFMAAFAALFRDEVRLSAPARVWRIPYFVVKSFSMSPYSAAAMAEFMATNMATAPEL